MPWVAWNCFPSNHLNQATDYWGRMCGPLCCVHRMTDLDTFFRAGLTPRERLRVEKLAQIKSEARKSAASGRLSTANYRRPLNTGAKRAGMPNCANTPGD
jgi:hypothetical protein